MKKILFLTHYFPPEVNAPANRTYEHCRQWAKDKDVEVTVITNFPNHPDGKIFNGYKNSFYKKEVIDNINVVRVWTFITPNEGLLLRILNYIIFMKMTILYVLFSGIQFDVIVATTPQLFCGIAGQIISWLKRKPFVLELRDLWPESIIAVGALKNKTIISILEKLELKLYHSADKIISVTKSFKKDLVNRGIPGYKIIIVYNGVSIDMFNGNNNIENKELKEFVEEGFIVGYIGTIGMAHSIISLVNAAERLRESEIKIVVVGSGANKENMEKEIKVKGLDNIKIFPLQSKVQIPAIINSLDLFCVHLKKNDLFKTVIPSKIFEGMIMKKPILLGVDGETREIIEDAQCGLYFEPENVNDLIEKILWYKNNPSVMSQHGCNGYNYVIKKFDREKLGQEMLRIILNEVRIN